MSDANPSLPLPCIVCHKTLEPAMNGLTSNQPWGGTCFQSRGHYGSAFDPMDGTLLEISVCDGCLRWATFNDRVASFKSARRKQEDQAWLKHREEPDEPESERERRFQAYEDRLSRD